MKIKLLPLIIFALITSSCAMYYPHTATPTQFTESNDVLVSASLNLQSLNANVAYSFAPKVYVHGAATSHYNKTFGYSGGLGFYHLFTPKFQCELQTEFGLGNFDFEWPTNTSSSPTRLIKKAKGSYVNYGGFASMSYFVDEKFSWGGIFKYSRPVLAYEDVNFQLLNGNHYSSNQFGLHIFMKYKIDTHLQFLLSGGLRYYNDFDYFYIHSTFAELRIGIEYKLK